MGWQAESKGVSHCDVKDGSAVCGAVKLLRVTKLFMACMIWVQWVGSLHVIAAEFDGLEEKINYRTACTSDTFCAKLVQATSVRVLPKCRPMIVYKKEKLPHFFELHS